MATRLPASQHTREELTALIEGRLSTASAKDELVKLATRLIVEEALEGEAGDALGREYYEHGAQPGQGTLPPEAIVANGHGVASNIQGTNLCYRADKFRDGGPKSWVDFWDVKKFPGSRGLCINDSPRTLIFALLADGVPADRLYPLDIERAFKKLNEIKPHIKVWWREGNQSQQLIRDGEVDMMSIWNGRATELKLAGVPVELVWNGAVRSTSTWCVLKGAPNRKLAWEFIQFAT